MKCMTVILGETVNFEGVVIFLGRFVALIYTAISGKLTSAKFMT